MATQLLKNPTLNGFSVPPLVVVDDQGKQQYIEHPDNWRFVNIGGVNNDPHLIPQSLHRDRGYDIAAGWRAWEGGYTQDVKLTKGQRYVAKAVFAVHVEPRTARIEWRFAVSRGGNIEAASAWATGPYGAEIDHLFVIEARQDVTVSLGFFARSPWADNACDFNVFSITLEPVAADYGDDSVSYIGSAGDSQPPPEPEPDEEPETPPPVPPPVGVEPAWMAALSKSKRARIALGRLMQQYGDELRPWVVGDDEAYELIGIMAGMLDAQANAGA